MRGAYWTPEGDAQLRALVAAGMTYVEIGRQMKVSRGAVRGRACRMGLHVTRPVGRPATSQNPKRAKRKSERMPIQASVMPALESVMPGEVLVDEPVQPAVAVLPRRAGQCAYPMWGGGRPTHVYCSEAAINTGRGAPIYCEEHATRCFTRTCVIEAPTAVPGYNAWGNFGW